VDDYLCGCYLAVDVPQEKKKERYQTSTFEAAQRLHAKHAAGARPLLLLSESHHTKAGVRLTRKAILQVIPCGSRTNQEQSHIPPQVLSCLQQEGVPWR